MTKQFQRWLRTIVVSLLFIPSIALAQDAKSLGSSTGSDALSRLGSREGIKQNITNPLISSGAPMQTLDSSVSFNAQVLCPSSASFLKVFIQPSPSGDLGLVMVSQDLDMNNSTDYSYSVPYIVSGVCANGVISCSAGTWQNCIPYKWVADSSGRVSLQSVALTDLGGCYCINNSCGSNLVWNNLSTVLKSLGGGVVGAVQGVNSQFAVSDVKIEDTFITYYGQRSGGCANPGGSGVVDPQRYYTNWATLSADTETLKITQSADPGSYYNLLSQSLANQQNPAELMSCNINRVVTCQDVSTYNVGYSENISNGCATLEGRADCVLKEEIVDGVYVYRNFNPTRLLPIASCMVVTVQKTASCKVSGSVCGGLSYSCPLDSSIPCNLNMCSKVEYKNVCPEWWKKERVYKCETNPVDFSDSQKRVEKITSTVKDNSTLMYYQDLRKDDAGNWVTESMIVGLGRRDSYESCEKACKVRRPVVDTQAAIRGHTAQVRTGTQAFDFFYKPCTSACPVSDGEEIVMGCQCINEFAEATAVMQALRIAGKDVVCSSGVAKPLGR